MPRWIACFAVCLLTACLLTVQTVFVRAESPEKVSLLAKSDWAKFHIVLGKIEVANIHSSQTRTTKRGTVEAGSFEKLSIIGDTVVPTVRYQRITNDDTVELIVVNGERVEISRKLKKGTGPVQVEFQQARSGQIVLQLTSDGTVQTVRSQSIWHLLASSPEAFNDHVSPLLKILHPGWDFEQQAARITDELVFQAQNSDFAARRDSRRLVAQLASDDFATRQTAQRQLVAAGLPILPHLKQMSPSLMTREQQRRVDQICSDIQGKVPDSPERVALWLVEDEAIWLSMLGHDELPIRQIAATHLSKRLAKPLGFDPDGTQQERSQQIANLRTRMMVR